MVDNQYLGQRLIERSFETWFRYMFRIIERRPFIVEPIHPDLFSACQNVYEGNEKRLCINMPPRSAKTTLMSYFTAFCFTVNSKSEIIYTSYSQSLLKEISGKVACILEHPVYKAMYPNNMVQVESEELDPIDEFWKDYLYKECKKNTYTSFRIQTAQRGLCLFASIGSQITGYGAGARGSKKFSGALIIDDANKPADVHHETKRNNVLRYYEETLLTRLNNPDTPIINVQQRLHVADLSGLLKDKYNFTMLKKPLLDKNGVCQIPSQYTKERINELQQNNYMFSSQYMQEPVILGGQVIKRAWFRYYPTVKEYNYKRIIITADTAMKIKEHNDYSVFLAGGITQDNHLHVLDMLRGKWEAPELEKMAVTFWNRFKRNDKTGLMCNGFYVEDKASGSSLLQILKSRYGIPVTGLQTENDKLTRVEGILTYINAGQVYLPENENYGFNPDLLSECEAFSRDMSQLHDDIVDTLVYLIREGIGRNTVSILDYFL